MPFPEMRLSVEEKTRGKRRFPLGEKFLEKTPGGAVFRGDGRFQVPDPLNNKEFS